MLHYSLSSSALQKPAPLVLEALHAECVGTTGATLHISLLMHSQRAQGTPVRGQLLRALCRCISSDMYSVSPLGFLPSASSVTTSIGMGQGVLSLTDYCAACLSGPAPICFTRSLSLNAADSLANRLLACPCVAMECLQERRNTCCLSFVHE